MDATLVAEATPAIKTILENFAEKLSKPLSKMARSAKDQIVVSLQIGFEDYLKTSYNRCCKFKTLLNPDIPLEITKSYINVTMMCGGESIPDVQLIKDLNERKSVVVTGLAGSGKSMFMKYLTASKFESPDGRVPLFVELRHTNQLSNADILTFVRSYCASKSNNITEDQFDIALKAGSITLIFDGFDEVNHDRRDNIQQQILEVRKNYPEVTIVVSSRPDERFGSWSSFYVYKVDKLSKPQCLALIDGLHYNKGVKIRFRTEVDKSLYESHESFLSSPLLTTIMLLTYEEFAEIPQKVHAFYSQAFDTLFQKHDAQKDQFQRKTRTNFTRDEFRSCFSTFCAMSYLEERFSFTDTKLRALAERAIRYTGDKNKSLNRSVTPEQFIEDLISSVCMILQDGMEWSFVHRSFQEYFAAAFVTTTHGENAQKILDRYARRFGDSVIPMALEMDRETIEQTWVLPTISRLESVFFGDDVSGNVALQFRKAFPKLIIYYKQGMALSLDAIALDVVGPVQALRRSYHCLAATNFPGIHEVSSSRLKSVVKRYGKEDESNAAKIKQFLTPAKTGRINVDTNRHLAIELDENDSWWLSELEIDKMFNDIKKGFLTIRKDIEMRQRSRSDILREYFPS